MNSGLLNGREEATSKDLFHCVTHDLHKHIGIRDMAVGFLRDEADELLSLSNGQWPVVTGQPTGGLRFPEHGFFLDSAVCWPPDTPSKDSLAGQAIQADSHRSEF
jgi:hypothetical protein